MKAPLSSSNLSAFPFCLFHYHCYGENGTPMMCLFKFREFVTKLPSVAKVISQMWLRTFSDESMWSQLDDMDSWTWRLFFGLEGREWVRELWQCRHEGQEDSVTRKMFSPSPHNTEIDHSRISRHCGPVRSVGLRLYATAINLCFSSH